MATFLRNLPSFNKDNFSNFQPDNNKFLPRKQSIFSCNNVECPFEQIIVNKRCNLLIQFLEKKQSVVQVAAEHADDDQMEKKDATECEATTLNVSKKRYIDELTSQSSKSTSRAMAISHNTTTFTSTSSSSDDRIDNGSDQHAKRRRSAENTNIESNMIANFSQSSSTNNNNTSQETTETSEMDTLVEVDVVDDDVDDDVMTSNGASRSNNEDEIDV